MNTYRAHMLAIVRVHGFAEARRLCEQDRNRSSPGTFSYALLNAVLREFDMAATVGKVAP